MVKRIWVASAVSALCTSREALWRSIDALHAHLDTYDLKVWSILREWDTCAASVKELEEVLAAEESTDKEAEMREEKVCYNAKRGAARQEVVDKEDKDGGKGEGESESDEEDNEPVHGPGLLAKAQGKHPAK